MKTVNKQGYAYSFTLLEVLYLSVMAMFVLKRSFEGTLFYMPWPEIIDTVLRILCFGVIILRLGFVRANAVKKFLLCILTCTMFIGSWRSTEYAFLLDLALLTMGAIGIPLRKILKTGFWAALYVLSLAILGSLTGCISDLLYWDWWANPRHAFGTVYPTDFAAHVTFLALTGWVIYGGNMVVFPIIYTIGLSAFVYIFCHAKCSAVILCLLAFGIAYNAFAKRFGRRGGKIYTIINWIDHFLICIMPLCALAMICLTVLYGKGNETAKYINIQLTDRLRLGWNAIVTYGLNPFGTAFDLIGSGGTTIRSLVFEYNFVDSSYIMIMVRYGYMSLLAICGQYIWMQWNAVRKKYREFAIAYSLVAIHSMIEHHLPEMEYNLFLILPFAVFTEDGLTLEKHNLTIKRTFVSHALFLIVLLTITVTGLRSTAYIKTIVDVLRLDEPKRHIWFVGLSTFLLLMLVMLFFLLLKALTASIEKTFPPKKIFVWAGIIICAFLCAFITGEQTIRLGQETYRTTIELDTPAIEVLLDVNESAGKLYIDCLPEIYSRKFNGIKSTLLAAEGLSLYENTTLITDHNEELRSLLTAGYQYGTLPSGHAVYTNSMTAQSLLEDTGVTLTDYYSRKTTVNLSDIALWNNFNIAEDNTLLLNGYGNSLWHGPGITVYEGKLRVEYKLKLIKCPMGEGPVATAQVSSEWGLILWNQSDIYSSDFDKANECIYTMDVNFSADCPYVEFQLIVPDGVQLELQEISYWKLSA